MWFDDLFLLVTYFFGLWFNDLFLLVIWWFTCNLMTYFCLLFEYLFLLVIWWLVFSCHLLAHIYLWFHNFLLVIWLLVFGCDLLTCFFYSWYGGFYLWFDYFFLLEISQFVFTCYMKEKIACDLSVVFTCDLIFWFFKKIFNLWFGCSGMKYQESN